MTQEIDHAPYVLEEGKEGKKRLDFQHTLHRDHLIKAFEEAASFVNLQGAHVVDFGCGASSAYADIAKLIGKSGRYTGIDTSPEQIATCKHRFKEAHYIVGDENSREVLACLSSADIIYMRFVVMHQKHPEEFLKKIYSALKPNAILIIQDPENTIELKQKMTAKYPYAADLCDFKMVLGRRIGLDYNFAKHLDETLRSLGVKILLHTTQLLQLPLPEFKKLLTLSSQEIHAKNEKILSAEETRHYLNIISQLPEDPSLFWSSEILHTVLARKV